ALQPAGTGTLAAFRVERDRAGRRGGFRVHGLFGHGHRSGDPRCRRGRARPAHGPARRRNRRAAPAPAAGGVVL
ncbi:MAG: hypothetical protein AVDCRST_MAG15-567, partial [uncultured Rubellimicrobium sp.]